jgi:hypothetical protein
MTKPLNEKIQFRLLHMPCCHIIICWANPRRPNYCPECGTFIFKNYPKAEWENKYSEAWLKVNDYDKATWLEMVKVVEDYHNGDSND